MHLDQATIDAAKRELYRRSLAAFVRDAWKVLEPGQPYVHGRHIDAMAEHLEAVTNGEITRLLINIAPGTMKSLLVGVFWPAWEWGPRGMANNRIIGASHELGLATRDARRMRLLVASEWYQRLWPIAFVGDQNQKTYFENNATGWRQACPASSLTGKRGDRVLFDDPHTVSGALSDVQREDVLIEIRESLPTRLNNPETSAIVFVMQRLHEGDASGLILENDWGYVHLCLPMEYERSRHCTTRIGFSDWRKQEGELLFPERFPESVVKGYKKTLGSYAYAGQMQQRPAPRSGGFFEWEKLKVIRAAPRCVETVRFWDKAGTELGGAYTAGVKMGRTVDGRYIVMDVVRGQWAAAKREEVIKQTANTDGPSVRIWVEQEPGSGGKESADATIRNLAGYAVKAERATGDKAVRAEPYAVQVEAGNVELVEGPWNKEFIDEHKSFPVGKYKDQIDAAGGAFNKVAAAMMEFQTL